MRLFSRRKIKSNPFGFIKSFSKIITAVWVIIWVEVVIFSQVATVLSLGDATSIQVINDNTKEIGLIITGAYFGTKCFENLARGYEEYQLNFLETRKKLRNKDKHETVENDYSEGEQL